MVEKETGHVPETGGTLRRIVRTDMLTLRKRNSFVGPMRALVGTGLFDVIGNRFLLRTFRRWQGLSLFFLEESKDGGFRPVPAPVQYVLQPELHIHFDTPLSDDAGKRDEKGFSAFRPINGGAKPVLFDAGSGGKSAGMAEATAVSAAASKASATDASKAADWQFFMEALAFRNPAETGKSAPAVSGVTGRTTADRTLGRPLPVGHGGKVRDADGKVRDADGKVSDADGDRETGEVGDNAIVRTAGRPDGRVVEFSGRGMFRNVPPTSMTNETVYRIGMDAGSVHREARAFPACPADPFRQAGLFFSGLLSLPGWPKRGRISDFFPLNGQNILRGTATVRSDLDLRGGPATDFLQAPQLAGVSSLPSESHASSTSRIVEKATDGLVEWLIGAVHAQTATRLSAKADTGRMAESPAGETENAPTGQGRIAAFRRTAGRTLLFGRHSTNGTNSRNTNSRNTYYGKSGRTVVSGAAGFPVEFGSADMPTEFRSADMPGTADSVRTSRSAEVTEQIGRTGSADMSGRMGLTDMKGTKGATGANGVPASAAAAKAMSHLGSDGALGVSASDGADGALGVPGSAGADGLSGYNGTSGAGGLSGYDGTSGADGMAGFVIREKSAARMDGTDTTEQNAFFSEEVEYGRILQAIPDAGSLRGFDFREETSGLAALLMEEQFQPRTAFLQQMGNAANRGAREIGSPSEGILEHLAGYPDRLLTGNGERTGARSGLPKGLNARWPHPSDFISALGTGIANRLMTFVQNLRSSFSERQDSLRITDTEGPAGAAQSGRSKSPAIPHEGSARRGNLEKTALHAARSGILPLEDVLVENVRITREKTGLSGDYELMDMPSHVMESVRKMASVQMEQPAALTYGNTATGTPRSFLFGRMLLQRTLQSLAWRSLARLASEHERLLRLFPGESRQGSDLAGDGRTQAPMNVFLAFREEMATAEQVLSGRSPMSSAKGRSEAGSALRPTTGPERDATERDAAERGMGFLAAGVEPGMPAGPIRRQVGPMALAHSEQAGRFQPTENPLHPETGLHSVKRVTDILPSARQFGIGARTRPGMTLLHSAADVSTGQTLIHPAAGKPVTSATAGDQPFSAASRRRSTSADHVDGGSSGLFHSDAAVSFLSDRVRDDLKRTGAVGASGPGAIAVSRRGSASDTGTGVAAAAGPGAVDGGDFGSFIDSMENEMVPDDGSGAILPLQAGLREGMRLLHPSEVSGTAAGISRGMSAAGSAGAAASTITSAGMGTATGVPAGTASSAASGPFFGQSGDQAGSSRGSGLFSGYAGRQPSGMMPTSSRESTLARNAADNLHLLSADRTFRLPEGIRTLQEPRSTSRAFRFSAGRTFRPPGGIRTLQDLRPALRTTGPIRRGGSGDTAELLMLRQQTSGESYAGGSYTGKPFAGGAYSGEMYADRTEKGADQVPVLESTFLPRRPAETVMKSLNTPADSSVRDARRISGTGEWPGPVELNRLVDKVYAQLETRLARERRRYGK